ncbi:MAG: orotidine-5'-phosphate decarboxylase [Bacteroidales bacterium]|jgi:orotidine-5'-phosphate decarboxylase|nr:orotidine-5'-phosphate decarboxylase [Bacteroidales bacterium]
MMIIDTLFEAVKEKGHVCVGLDTDFGYIPHPFACHYDSVAEAVFAFNREIIEATIDVAACYKVQIAYYEALGIEGLRAYKQTLAFLRERGAIVIADVKRGDIAKTAEMYAQAHFTGDFECNFMTINPYMGLDSLTPYLPYLKNHNKGLFVLVRTSNEGAKDIENLFIDTGNREHVPAKDAGILPAPREKVYQRVGHLIQKMGAPFTGTCGYSSVGGVMGCTHAEEAIETRELLNSTFFLIPGYGAQGGTAQDIALYLKNGNGGVVNASRSILLAYKKIENGEIHFAEAAREETTRMRDNIRNAIRVSSF